MENELFKRCKGNPILTPSMFPYSSSVARVFNPGAILFNESVLLLVRVEDKTGYSHLTVARSKNGKTGWDIGGKPTLQAEEREKEHKKGLEDPRIVLLKDGRYIISCVSFRTDFDRNPHTISLISTKDFETFKRISRPPWLLDKNAALFSEKIDGRFVLAHRPSVNGQTCIAVSFSPDLIHWGGIRQVLSPEPGTWCNFRVGLATPPIKTKHGWLIIFHGSKDIASKLVYSVGLAMLDSKTLNLTHRTKEWVFAPRMGYEGGNNGIVFPCGAVVVDGELFMYYGAKDSTVALATANFENLLDHVMQCPVD